MSDLAEQIDPDAIDLPHDHCHGGVAHVLLEPGLYFLRQVRRRLAGSGGALAIAVADRVLMMENAIYSVISPEACAAIMWRDSTKKELAAQALKVTAKDLSELGCVDGIVEEPDGGAQNNHEDAAALLDVALQRHYSELKKMAVPELVASRYNKFRNMAQFFRVEA